MRMNHKNKYLLLLLLVHYFKVIYSNWIELKIPNSVPKKPGYLCTYERLPAGISYAVKFQPKLNTQDAERIFLFGCSSYRSSKRYWYCNKGSPCANEDGGNQMIYMWSKGIKDVELPANVGFKLGRRTNFVVMQVYYPTGVGSSAGSDGVDIYVTSLWQKYVAGMYSFSSNEFNIPETNQPYHVDIGCQFHGGKIAPFAYRCEADSAYAQAVLAYRVRGNKWTLIANASPQDVQGFYRISDDDMMVIRPEDYLASSCVYYEGVQSRKETCKLYLMYYMVNTAVPFVQYDEVCDSIIQGKKKMSKGVDDIAVMKVTTTERPKTGRSNAHLSTSPTDASLSTTGNDVRLTTTENNIPFNTPKNNIPLSATETNIRLPTTENNIHLSTPENNPRLSTPENNIHLSTPENNIHLSTPENNPRLSTPEKNLPLTNVKDNLRLSTPENNIRLSTPETTRPTRTLPNNKIYTKEITSEPLQPLSMKPKITIDPSSTGPKPKLIGNWKIGNKSKIGFISSVTLNTHGEVVALHRGSRNIFAHSFDDEHYYKDFKKPIEHDTIVRVSASTGAILDSFGSNIFYLPYSLTIDGESNYWIADIGLHQVIKFSSFNTTSPSLVLGVASIPGSDEKHFCKPTDVAVDKYGNVFVADGYCNSRIMKFNKAGKLIKKWGASSQNFNGNIKNDYFAIPHSLTIDDKRKHLYVSDLKNGRILKFSTAGNFLKVFQDIRANEKLFSINFNSAYGGIIYTISSVFKKSGAVGQIISTETGRVVTKWRFVDRNFDKPYDIVVSADNRELYIAVNSSLWKLKVDNPKQIEDGESRSISKDGVRYYSEIRIIKASENDNSMRTALIVAIVLGTPIVLSIMVLCAQTIIMKLRHRKAKKKRKVWTHLDNITGSTGVLFQGCCITHKHYFDSSTGMHEYMIASGEDSDISEDDLFTRKT